MLADFLYEGQAYGVPPDYRESLTWAQKAADAGDPRGKAVLGFHYFDGGVIEGDWDKARALAMEAIDAGNAKGKALLASLLYSGDNYAQERERVLSLARDAAEAAEPSALGLLALMYAFDETLQDNTVAERWARQGAGRADPYSNFVLGWLYFNGFVVEQNYVSAWAYLTLADMYMTDTGIAPGGPLLPRLEALVDEEGREQARLMQRNWFKEWGLEYEE
ncbi:sel1 repeat family protein [Desulfovibrio sp. OttesenSCG-928-A18]|nr:sel1 repeat family protein [Desulfovibrio sp. OttesenSCG-928-A18]